MTVEQWAPWAALVLGLVNFVAGILAYRGRYRAWLVLKGSFLPGRPGLASLYLGLAFMLIGVGPLVLAFAPPLVQLVHFFLLFPTLAVGIVAMFWLPSVMLPAWVKDTRRKIASGEDRLSRALAPGGVLHGRLVVGPGTQSAEKQSRHPAHPDDASE